MADFFVNAEVRISEIKGVDRLLKSIREVKVSITPRLSSKNVVRDQIVRQLTRAFTIKTRAVLVRRRILEQLKTPFTITVNPVLTSAREIRNRLAGQTVDVTFAPRSGETRRIAAERLRNTKIPIQFTPSRGTTANVKAFFANKTFDVNLKARITNRGELTRTAATATAPTVAAGGVAAAGNQFANFPPRTAVTNLNNFSNQVNGLNNQFQQLGQSVPVTPLQELERSGGSAGDRIAKAFGLASGSAEAFGITLGVVLRRFLAFAFASRALIAIQAGFRAAISAGIEFGQGLANLAKVSREVRGQTQLFGQEQINLAKAFSVTISSVQEIQLEFARQGRTAQETAALTSAALLSINAAALTSNDAVELLTLSVNVFGISALNASSIIDRLTSLADNNAVTVQDLTEAFRRSASVLNEANVSFETAASLITIVRENTRLSARQIGTAFKSIIPSIINTQDQLEELGVVTRNSLGEFDFTQTIRNINKLFANLTTEQKFNLVIDLVGKRQADRFLALVNNINDVEEDLAIQAASAGNAIEKQALQVATFSSRLEKLRATIFDVISATGALGFGELGKDAIDSITSVIDTFGGLLKIVSGTGLPLAQILTGFVALKVAIPLFGGIINGVKKFIGLIRQSSSGVTQLSQNFTQVGQSSRLLFSSLAQSTLQQQQLTEAAQQTLVAEQEVLPILDSQLQTKSRILSSDKEIQLVGTAITKTEQSTLSALQAESKVSKELLDAARARTKEADALAIKNRQGRNVSIEGGGRRGTGDALLKNARATTVETRNQIIARKTELALTEQRLRLGIQSFGVDSGVVQLRANSVAQLKLEIADLERIVTLETNALVTEEQRAVALAAIRKQNELQARSTRFDAGAKQLGIALQNSGKVLNVELQKAFFKAETRAERLSVLLRSGAFTFGEVLQLGVTKTEARLAKVKNLGKSLLPSEGADKLQNSLFGLTLLLPILTKSLSGFDNVASKAATGLADSLQTSVFAAFALKSVSETISFGAAFGGIAAVLVSIKAITAIADQFGRESKLESQFKRQNEELKETLGSLSSLRSNLRELSQTDALDIEKRINLTNQIIQGNTQLVGLRSELLSLDQERLKSFEKEIGLSNKILSNLRQQRDSAIELTSQGGSIRLAQEAASTQKSAANITGAIVGIGTAIAVFAAGPLGLVGATLAGVAAAAGGLVGLAGALAGGAAAGLFQGDFERDISSREELVRLQEKLNELGLDEVEERKKIQKLIGDTTQTIDRAFAANLSVFRLQISNAKTEERRNRLTATFLFNTLKINGALDDETSKFFEQEGLLESLNASQLAQIEGASRIAKENADTNKELKEGNRLIEAGLPALRKREAETAKIKILFSDLVSDLRKIKILTEQAKFDIEVQKTQNDIDNIRAGIDQLPKEFGILVTLSQDEALLKRTLASITNAVDSTTNTIQQKFSSGLFSEDEQKRIENIFNDIGTEQFLSALQKIDDFRADDTNKTEEIKGQLSDIVKNERERVKSAQQLQKILALQQRAIKEAGAELQKGFLQVSIAGLELSPLLEAQLEINKLTSELKNLDSQIKSDGATVTSLLEKRKTLTQDISNINTEIARTSQDAFGDANIKSLDDVTDELDKFKERIVDSFGDIVDLSPSIEASLENVFKDVDVSNFSSKIDGLRDRLANDLRVDFQIDDAIKKLDNLPTDNVIIFSKRDRTNFESVENTIGKLSRAFPEFTGNLIKDFNDVDSAIRFNQGSVDKLKNALNAAVVEIVPQSSINNLNAFSGELQDITNIKKSFVALAEKENDLAEKQRIIAQGDVEIEARRTIIFSKQLTELQNKLTINQKILDLKGKQVRAELALRVETQKNLQAADVNFQNAVARIEGATGGGVSPEQTAVRIAESNFNSQRAFAASLTLGLIDIRKRFSDVQKVRKDAEDQLKRDFAFAEIVGFNADISGDEDSRFAANQKVVASTNRVIDAQQEQQSILIQLQAAEKQLLKIRIDSGVKGIELAKSEAKQREALLKESVDSAKSALGLLSDRGQLRQVTRDFRRVQSFVGESGEVNVEALVANDKALAAFLSVLNKLPASTAIGTQRLDEINSALLKIATPELLGRIPGARELGRIDPDTGVRDDVKSIADLQREAAEKQLEVLQLEIKNIEKETELKKTLTDVTGKYDEITKKLLDSFSPISDLVGQIATLVGPQLQGQIAQPQVNQATQQDNTELGERVATSADKLVGAFEQLQQNGVNLNEEQLKRFEKSASFIPGEISLKLTQEGGNVVSIDLSPNTIAELAEAIKNTKTSPEDAIRLFFSGQADTTGPGSSF